MAGSTSKWTRLGSNTNNDIDTAEGVALNEANVDIVAGSGINAQVRHECHMWLDDADPITTDPFDWIVDTDFTVVMNSAKATLASTNGNVDVDIDGSIDGENYVKMGDVMSPWVSGTATVGQGVYDFEANGRMPYMRITVTCGTDYDNTATPIKINVFMHTT